LGSFEEGLHDEKGGTKKFGAVGAKDEAWKVRGKVAEPEARDASMCRIDRTVEPGSVDRRKISIPSAQREALYDRRILVSVEVETWKSKS